MTEFPSGLQILLDGDVIRYEIGYAAETGWAAKTNSEDVPPFSYVEEMLLQRLANLKATLKTDLAPKIYISEGKNFRYEIAKRRKYKSSRAEKKPAHFKNLTVYLRDILGAETVTDIEADDALAIAHTASDNKTILVSRDKDMRQVPGWYFSWELGKQAAIGPVAITDAGSLTLSEDHKKLTGFGFPWFAAQVLMGDPVDSIPGLKDCGPVLAYNLLHDWPSGRLKSRGEIVETLKTAYVFRYGITGPSELEEQAKLCWLIRRLDENGKPEMWSIAATA